MSPTGRWQSTLGCAEVNPGFLSVAKRLESLVHPGGRTFISVEEHGGFVVGHIRWFRKRRERVILVVKRSAVSPKFVAGTDIQLGRQGTSPGS
jgi:hypothetical protein